MEKFQKINRIKNTFHDLVCCPFNWKKYPESNFLNIFIKYFLHTFYYVKYFYYIYFNTYIYHLISRIHFWNRNKIILLNFSGIDALKFSFQRLGSWIPMNVFTLAFALVSPMSHFQALLATNLLNGCIITGILKLKTIYQKVKKLVGTSGM